jgi:hypothetical protein
MRRILYSGAVGPGYGVAIAVGEVHIIGAHGIMVLETVYLAAVMFEQVFHSVVFIVLGWLFIDGMLNGARGGQQREEE